jgi:hypothetical protein
MQSPNGLAPFSILRTIPVLVGLVEVSLLVHQRQAAGTYEVKFNGSNLASGVYFYRLQAEGFIASKKLLLMR